MKIVVTATESSLDAQVDPRFGRGAQFLIVETDDMSFEALENPNIAAGGGAGIQSAKLVADKGVQVVLTGHCGPNAFSALEAAGIQVIIGVEGSVREAIEAYKSGGATPAGGPDVDTRFGVGGRSTNDTKA